MTPDFDPPAELGELGDAYEFLHELGRGGSAIVYRARDRALGRDVAIKVVHPRLTSSDDDQVARLAREARTVAQLQHPGIVTVYAVRRLQSGGITLVMQFVPGLTLKAAIQSDGPFSAERTESVLRDVAGALAYAHARQIVHRDVKPENIFLDADTGRALLADFGIARVAEADSLTMTGTAIGTPFYMSPEQVDGKPVDGRSDLYSLGLVTWEMLTGLRPWDGESLYHVIYKQKHDELPPIEAIRRDVPRRLQYIVERMLQKHPGARWAGVDGLLAQLDQQVLPADYGQWQAALPSRITRHRAVAGLQRPGTPKADPAAVAAATIQFAAADGARRDPPVLDVGNGPLGSAPVTLALCEFTCSSDPVDGPPPSLPHTASPAPGSGPEVGGYDSIPPTWAYADPETPRGSARRWDRRAAGFAVLAVVLGGGTALSATSRPRSDRPGVATASALRPLASVPGSLGSALARRWHARHAAADSTAATAVSAVDLAPDLLGVGERHQCSITLGGTAQCWGDNEGGQLGDGSRLASARLPRPVIGVMRYAGLGAGATHTCGVTEPGDVYCWGSNTDGELGDGTTIRRSAPVRIAGTGTYRLVRGGRAHTCALDVEGQVRCWGSNVSGQLGDGTWDSRSIPTLVRLPAQRTAITVAVGEAHSCAVLNDNRVVCWGANGSGQLGVPGDSAEHTPRVVPGVRATALAAGGAHTCAVLVSGPVRCWGRDDSGQLGAESSQDGAVGRMTVIPGGEDVRAIAAGTSHTCALTRGGWAWCWGRTSAGVRRAPYRVGRGPYVALVAGGARSCAVPRGRVPECWTGADVWIRRARGLREPRVLAHQ